MRTATKSLFLRAYWDRRDESLAATAARISEFLDAAGAADSALATWLLEGLGTSGAFRRADISPRGIERLFRSGNSASGLSLTLWNGLNASFHVTIRSKVRRDSVVLSFLPNEEPRDPSTWRRLMSAAIEAFDPDSAVVAGHESTFRETTRDAGASAEWFTYRRGEGIAEHRSS